MDRQEYQRQYREEHKETLLAKKKEYYISNKEQITKRKKEYYENNKQLHKDQMKNYYENNKQQMIQNAMKYKRENKEKVKEYVKCRGCKLYQTHKRTNFLCSYCNPNRSIRQKTKELRVKRFLEEQQYTIIHNKKCNIDQSCQMHFPDFIIDCQTFFLIIECDEFAHSTYGVECERIRENNICFALGLPCVFLRYNPDKKNVKQKVKEMVLKSHIEYYKNNDYCDNEVVFLFY